MARVTDEQVAAVPGWFEDDDVEPFRLLLEHTGDRSGQGDLAELVVSAFEAHYRAAHGDLPVVVGCPSAAVLDHASPGTHRFVHVEASHEHVVCDPGPCYAAVAAWAPGCRRQHETHRIAARPVCRLSREPSAIAPAPRSLDRRVFDSFAPGVPG